VKPYPYKERRRNHLPEREKKAKISLAGALTLQPGQGPLPPPFYYVGYRDPATSAMKSSWDIALSGVGGPMTRKGVAVLRFD